MADAPDYTLLSDVNVVGSVTLNVNVVGSVTINTNITGASSTVVLNVNVTNEVLQSKLAKPALAFDGVDDYVSVEDNPSIRLTTYTIEVWYRPLRFDDIDVLLYKHCDATRANYCLQVRNGKLYSDYKDVNGVPHSVSGTGLLTLHDYNQCVNTYDGSTYALYLNGDLDNSISVEATPDTSAGYDLEVGRYSAGNPLTPQGSISIVRVYNRALSSDEISHNYSHPQDPVVEGLVLWLNFDEGVGTVAYDRSGSGNHGTIHGAVWVSEQGQVAPLLNVNLTASQITMNINITAQDINVKIVTPSGIPAYIGTSFVNKTETGITVINAGSESDALLSLTGRGRLISIAFWLRTGDPDSDASRSGLMDNEIRIYIDGSSTPQVTITMEELDRLNGHQIWGQAINAGAGTVGNYTAPLGPRGGIGFAQRASYVTVDGFEATRVCGLYKCDVEFTTGLVVKWYNPDSVNLSVNLIFEYGHYPGGE